MEGRYGHRDVLPWRWYVLVQHKPIHYDRLDGKLGGWWSAVGFHFIPLLHPEPILRGKGGGRVQEGFYISPGCLCPTPYIRLQDSRDLEA